MPLPPLARTGPPWWRTAPSAPRRRWSDRQGPAGRWGQLVYQVGPSRARFSIVAASRSTGAASPWPRWSQVTMWIPCPKGPLQVADLVVTALLVQGPAVGQEHRQRCVPRAVGGDAEVESVMGVHPSLLLGVAQILPDRCRVRASTLRRTALVLSVRWLRSLLDHLWSLSTSCGQVTPRRTGQLRLASSGRVVSIDRGGGCRRRTSAQTRSGVPLNRSWSAAGTTCQLPSAISPSSCSAPQPV